MNNYTPKTAKTQTDSESPVPWPDLSGVPTTETPIDEVLDAMPKGLSLVDGLILVGKLLRVHRTYRTVSPPDIDSQRRCVAATRCVAAAIEARDSERLAWLTKALGPVLDHYYPPHPPKAREADADDPETPRLRGDIPRQIIRARRSRGTRGKS